MIEQATSCIRSTEVIYECAMIHLNNKESMGLDKVARCLMMCIIVGIQSFALFQDFSPDGQNPWHNIEKENVIYKMVYAPLQNTRLLLSFRVMQNKQFHGMMMIDSKPSKLDQAREEFLFWAERLLECTILDMEGRDYLIGRRLQANTSYSLMPWGSRSEKDFHNSLFKKHLTQLMARCAQAAKIYEKEYKSPSTMASMLGPMGLLLFPEEEDTRISTVRSLSLLISTYCCEDNDIQVYYDIFKYKLNDVIMKEEERIKQENIQKTYDLARLIKQKAVESMNTKYRL